MSSDTVSITILDKEYQIDCPADEREALVRSALDLDQRMRTIRRDGNVFGLERIAVMAALNLSYELLDAKSDSAPDDVSNKEIKRLDSKLFDALEALSSPSWWLIHSYLRKLFTQPVTSL